MTFALKKFSAAKTAAPVAGAVCAVALSQAIHFLGAVSGTGKLLAVLLLPMHLPILAVGFFAGPISGAAAGFFAAFASAALSGMPAGLSLPLMAAELSAYGFFAGIFAKTSLPCAAKVLAAQLLGRIARMAAVAAAILLFGKSLPLFGIWVSSASGICGIALQVAAISALSKKWSAK